MLKEPTFYVDELVKQTRNVQEDESPIARVTKVDRILIHHKHIGSRGYYGDDDFSAFEKIPIEVGDKVRCVETRIEFVVNCIDGYFCSGRSCEKGTFYTEKKNAILIEKGGTISKSERIKEKIRNLNNGWNKDADDVLEEIGIFYKITISKTKYNSFFDVVTWNKDCPGGYKVKSFKFDTQCQKHTTFQKILFYLLNESSLNEKQEEIEKLQREIDDKQKRLDDLTRR